MLLNTLKLLPTLFTLILSTCIHAQISCYRHELSHRSLFGIALSFLCRRGNKYPLTPSGCAYVISLRLLLVFLPLLNHFCLVVRFLLRLMWMLLCFSDLHSS